MRMCRCAAGWICELAAPLGARPIWMRGAGISDGPVAKDLPRTIALTTVEQPERRTRFDDALKADEAGRLTVRAGSFVGHAGRA